MKERGKLRDGTSRSERRLLLLNSGHSGSGSGMTLLGSAQHQRFIDPLKNSVSTMTKLAGEINALAKTGSLVLCLLEPCLKLLLSHLQVLDVGSGTIQERNLAGLLVGDGKGVLEATITVPELIASPLLRLDTLATNFLAAAAIRIRNEY